MRFSTTLLCVFLAAGSLVAGDYELLKRCTTDESIPFPLFDTYTRFVAAMATADQVQVSSFCRTGSVHITAETRPAGKDAVGDDINLQFARKGFEKHILSVVKESEDLYRIQTATTTMWFTLVNPDTWKLSKYVDKPHE